MVRKPSFDNDQQEDDNVPSPPRSMTTERKIALFIDFENIAIGVIDAKYKKFEVSLLLATPRKREDRRQARLLRLGQVSGVQAGAARSGHRTDRDPLSLVLG